MIHEDFTRVVLTHKMGSAFSRLFLRKLSPWTVAGLILGLKRTLPTALSPGAIIQSAAWLRPCPSWSLFLLAASCKTELSYRH